MNPYSATSCKACYGFSLIEMLISLIILSLGILPLIALQIATLRYSNSAFQRFEASLLAQDILEVMRTNRGPISHGQYDRNVHDETKSPDNITKQDLARWEDSLSQKLPMGTGLVRTYGTEAEITVHWIELGTSNDGNRTMVLTIKSEL